MTLSSMMDEGMCGGIYCLFCLEKLTACTYAPKPVMDYEKSHQKAIERGKETLLKIMLTFSLKPGTFLYRIACAGS
jgi:hypothetical protein